MKLEILEESLKEVGVSQRKLKKMYSVLRRKLGLDKQSVEVQALTKRAYCLGLFSGKLSEIMR